MERHGADLKANANDQTEDCDHQECARARSGRSGLLHGASDAFNLKRAVQSVQHREPIYHDRTGCSAEQDVLE